ncbi:MAG TPA: cob(I)yrinic acid a,c-diamide adenosyltransferase [Bacteroidales bacterium]|nr:cob(I)yrinic acid a,c-diamide adenosyltransferase [Bacteroidales bacterium]HOR82365.1 cob(I)yrinic acid a,c-diamide adenosyltransferase [Bacteroidales bacterium]HPJ91073.1 cob(I)yrinic acid a,c-diamide adenosyltransferase [Bacteroidales bacterium]
MKIYTKKGDKGLTSLINKSNVPKDHQRVESYGTIDELNAHIGMLRSLSSSEEVAADLLFIQKTLFTIQTLLAVDSDAPCKLELPQLNQQDIDFLESKIDAMQGELEALKSFIIPGGSQLLSQCHIARCVCRRAERRIVALNRMQDVDVRILQFVNRLSDYLFVLSRFFQKKST